MRRLCGVAILAAAARAVLAGDPFVVTARLERAANAWEVVVTADVPPRHVLYADRFAVTAAGQPLAGRLTPPPVVEKDPALGESVSVFTSRVTGVYALKSAPGTGTLEVAVSLQGCSDRVCFLPRTQYFQLRVKEDAPTTNAVTGAAAPPGGEGWLDGASLMRQASGYIGPRDFLAFLDPQAAGTGGGGLRDFARDPAAFLRRQGLAWTLLLVLLGGLLLNLTPCVLPMIPINLAIIGAGVQAGSQRRGFLLGAAYGAGMALAYGALGLAVVLTGSVFGALQGSPIFSLAAAVLFLALAFAMFDVLPIDLSRFQKSGDTGRGFIAAAAAGGIAALLAGACVAPVVAAVLLLAGTLYRDGVSAAALLPFVLGVGMALPWPLAGAGLTVLPKPGVWMVWVKHGFGILIAIMAFYYGWLAYRGFAAPSPPVPDSNRLVAGDAEGWRRKVAAAHAAGKPLLLDFYASWCKNCHVMDHTTLRNPDVRQALEKFIVVRVETEHPDAAPASGMVQAFGVSGMPFYVVVEARP